MGQKLGRKLSNDEVAYAVHRSRAPKIKGISTAEVREGQLAHRRENACGLRGRESFDSVANEELITGNPPGNLPQFSHDPVKLQRRRSVFNRRISPKRDDSPCTSVAGNSRVLGPRPCAVRI